MKSFSSSKIPRLPRSPPLPTTEVAAFSWLMALRREIRLSLQKHSPLFCPALFVSRGTFSPPHLLSFSEKLRSFFFCPSPVGEIPLFQKYLREVFSRSNGSDTSPSSVVQLCKYSKYSSLPLLRVSAETSSFSPQRNFPFLSINVRRPLSSSFFLSCRLENPGTRSSFAKAEENLFFPPHNCLLFNSFPFLFDGPNPLFANSPSPPFFPVRREKKSVFFFAILFS